VGGTFGGPLLRHQPNLNLIGRIDKGFMTLFHEFCYGVSGVTERYLEVPKVFFNLSR
jgi:hypothetical protein